MVPILPFVLEKYARIRACLLIPRRPPISRPTISHLLSTSMALLIFKRCSRMPHTDVPPSTFALDAPFWKAANTGQLTDILTMDYVPCLIIVILHPLILAFMHALIFFILYFLSLICINLSAPYFIAHWPVLYLLYIVAIPYTHLFWLLLLYCFQAM